MEGGREKRGDMREKKVDSTTYAAAKTFLCFLVEWTPVAA